MIRENVPQTDFTIYDIEFKYLHFVPSNFIYFLMLNEKNMILRDTIECDSTVHTYDM